MNKGRVLPVLLISFLSACSVNKIEYIDVNSEVVKPPKDKAFDYLSCFNHILKKVNPPVAMAVYTEPFEDGSVPTRSTNGPLMDRGEILFQYYLSQAITKDQGLIFDQKPLIFLSKNQGNMGLNKYGVAEKESLKEHRALVTRFVNANRLAFTDKKVESVRYFRVKGTFTRNDKDGIKTETQNLNSKFSRDESSYIINGTLTDTNMLMGLTVILENPSFGYIVDTVSFRVSYDTKRQKYKVSSNIKKFDLGTSISRKQIESSESAQDALIKAAAFWAANKFYNDIYFMPSVKAQEEKQCSRGINEKP